MRRSAGARPSSTSWPWPSGSTRQQPSRSDGRVERVAVARRAGLVADREPVLTLGSRAMGPCLRVDLALCAGLDAVVADRGGRVEGLTDLLLCRRFEKSG